ncbi:PREDICTED: uncharacterized protein LOC104798551 [Tarenaya hassleriana]|uniref:uncharacterized protein LOC104798551 n=1 Tax=Tarenaya hassleriana TaxID=28532 RepID=UPI00053C6A47|nr:PREDICTED: uncharacterized protein LOC104798551 [Tarenaya hassleriana]XP_019056244.1 PREDICTED: uncharacterized protein LOC104798551 [Tarenaya hassleriana]XP_019056245.1 PREDICTED: uncharacterized protein LOC104798551 [Tarenaya hassleriana]XP_019056246.1 PREDICTED: uncharacterized protein LOC104798551 [Tarenaya hassleriana]
MREKRKETRETETDRRMGPCDRLQEALMECHRRVPAVAARRRTCGHLNRALAECIVSEACPEESEAVRSLCSSSGTRLKRRQCNDAQFSLSLCLSRHQQRLEDR